jgi:hypothetical protein
MVGTQRADHAVGSARCRRDHGQAITIGGVLARTRQ